MSLVNYSCRTFTAVIAAGILSYLAAGDPAGTPAGAMPEGGIRAVTRRAVYRSAAASTTLEDRARPILRAALVDSLTRLQPEAVPPAANAMHIGAARHEWVGFQVVVSARGADLSAVDVEGEALRGPHGARLAAPRLYREQYIQVIHPTPRSKAPAGWWPDALVPLRIEPAVRLPGAPRFRGAPFDVAAGHNQPVYGELYVPDNTPPGEYHGRLQVTSAGSRARHLSLDLTVWGFTLPATPVCRSWFADFGRTVRPSGLTPDTPEALALMRRYEASLLEHRLSPFGPAGAWPPPYAPDGTPDFTAALPALQRYFNVEHATGLELYLGPGVEKRDAAIRYLRGCYHFLEQHGWADLGYTYLVDEPNDMAAYDQVRSLAALVHEADPHIRFLCTEQPVSDNPAWGTLIGSVNLWCPLWPLWPEAALRERLRAGDEVWSYTALCQGDRETPFWELDFPLMNYRVALWQSWIEGCTGLLYWTTVDWDQTPDPWTNPETFEHYNGEGSLFYPGTAAGINGPVTSLRIKALRDGMQDYDYCAVLAKLRGQAAADAVVRQVARSWFDWNRDPQAIFAARRRLAEAILHAR